MRLYEPDSGNLWLARILWDSGAIQFGEFNIGTTMRSPIYINTRLMISNPRALRQVGELIAEQTRTLAGMLRPSIVPFEVAAGVPMGGLHLATAYSLIADVPMIYPHPHSHEDDIYPEIEGVYFPGQTVLMIDDLITGGSSVLETGAMLREAGLTVRDAVVLMDRQAGGGERLRADGISLHPLLKLETLVNYLVSRELITQAQYAQCLTYMEQTSGED